MKEDGLSLAGKITYTKQINAFILMRKTFVSIWAISGPHSAVVVFVVVNRHDTLSPELEIIL